MASNQIAVVIYTRHDPVFDVHINTARVQDALSREGYDVQKLEVDWASPDEWENLMTTWPNDTGRHHRGGVDTVGDEGEFRCWAGRFTYPRNRIGATHSYKGEEFHR